MEGLLMSVFAFDLGVTELRGWICGTEGLLGVGPGNLRYCMRLGTGELTFAEEIGALVVDGDVWIEIVVVVID
jgi:hypothetical protein